MDEQISEASKRRLVRYANAVRQVEMSSRKIYFGDRSYLDMGPSLGAQDEYAMAKIDLNNCPEPEIKALVYQIQIERADEAMEKSELDQRQADDNAMLAQNELVHLGHKFKSAEPQNQPRISRRKRNDRRNRRAGCRRCH